MSTDETHPLLSLRNASAFSDSPNVSFNYENICNETNTTVHDIKLINHKHKTDVQLNDPILPIIQISVNEKEIPVLLDT